MKKTSVFFISFFGILSLTYGQDEVQQWYNMPAIPSPQSWSFMQQGNHGINHNTGGYNFEVPIYHYKDADFDLSIGLG